MALCGPQHTCGRTLPAAVRAVLSLRYEWSPRRRRRRRGPPAGSDWAAPAASCAYRSIRIAGRMITVAESGAHVLDLVLRPARSSGRKLMTVPILLSPAPLKARSRSSVSI
jgi:hypothetical protein